MKTRLCSTLLSIVLLVVAILGVPPLAQASEQPLATVEAVSPAGPTAIGPGEIFRIRLTRLHCNDAQEEFPFFNHDEPYVTLAAIDLEPILAFPGTPQLTIAVTPYYDAVDDGDNRFPNLNVLNENVQDRVAVIAQVVERDTNVIDVADMAADAARAAFEDALAAGESDPEDLGRVVADALHTAVEGSDDDAIGPATLFMVTQLEFDGLAVNGSFTRSITAQSNNANYTLTFEIRRTA